MTADLGLARLISGIRCVVARDLDWDATAKLVADELAVALPDIDGLTPAQRLGSAERYTHHTLHVDPGGQFSILAIVWRPGQQTRIRVQRSPVLLSAAAVDRMQGRRRSQAQDHPRHCAILLRRRPCGSRHKSPSYLRLE